MSFGKANLLIFVFCYLIFESQCLEILSSNEDKIIVTTDSILRNTTTKLFSELKFNNWSKRLKHALLVHNFFTNVTLKDHNTLNDIIKLTRVERGDNETEQYMTALNDILNEDFNSTVEESTEYNDDYLLQYVDGFLDNMNGFKENIIDDTYDKLDIKDEIIHILTSEDPTQFNPNKQNITNITADALDIDSGYASDNEFWAPELETRRIYNGKATKIKHFPFMASIHIFNGFQCAGSIIKSDLILTAASCLQLAWNNRFFRENPAFLSVRVGSNFYTGGGEQIPVMEVYFYPEYNPRSLRNNIAIIRLLRHLRFNKRKTHVKKILVDQHASALPITTDGITIIGWGARGVRNIVLDPWSSRLAFSVLDIYDLLECKEIYSKEYVTHTNFCAGFISKGGGACNHDVGGPGVVNGILTGIISFGSPVCGTPDAPTVFTKVGYYADWIEDIMEQEVPHTKKKTTLLIPPPPPTAPPVYLRPSTFKIEPLGDPVTPVPLTRVDTLRILEDENLFKEFLATIFTSREANEFTDILFNNDKPAKKSNKDPAVLHDKDLEKLKTKQKKTHKEVKRMKTMSDAPVDAHEESNPEDQELHELVTDAGYHTKLDLYESDKDNKAYTLSMFADVDEDDSKDEEEDYDSVDKNIVRMLDQLSDRGTEEEKDEDTRFVTYQQPELKQVTKLATAPLTVKPGKRKKKVIEQPNKTKKESVLTLLYVSDNENSNDTLRRIEQDIEDFDENLSEGIPISADGFKDLTRTFKNNVTNEAKPKSVLDFMSQNELYDLLSEAIEEVAKYKKSRND